MREKLARFMQGRYGIDELGRFLMGTTFFILIMEMLTGWHVLTLVFWAIFILVYYRMFSRDYGKRYQENQKFLTARYMFNTKWHQIFYKKSNTYNNSGVKGQFHLHLDCRTQIFEKAVTFSLLFGKRFYHFCAGQGFRKIR